jgi:hypothetical protein
VDAGAMSRLALLSVVFLSSPAVAADDGKVARKSLIGLRGVSVLVEDLPTEAQRVGLTTGAIQTDAELRLRLAGIAVLSDDVADKTCAPVLYLDAMVYHTDQPLWGYSTTVALLQCVQLVRDPAIMVTNATTWEIMRVGGAARPPNVTDRVRTELKDQVDSFINAYLAMNPK